jgi:hypothetical protein
MFRLHKPSWQVLATCVLLLIGFARVAAQSPHVAGTVTDETGGAMPGVTVEVRIASQVVSTVTDALGRYRARTPAAGPADVSFTLVNFATVRRAIDLTRGDVAVNAVMHLSLSADVAVTGKSTFTNLADARDPSQSLIGVARSASQGAITARQIDSQPLMRPAEVLETVPGVVTTQHSGEGKANQYYLRGFNLDHGTDFATTVAGMPVNLPTHAHGQGYSDLNFLIPELTSGVQFSKGPYFAEHGDFATAGSANIALVNVLARPIARVGGGDQRFGRALVAGSRRAGDGHLLGAIELQRSDGPWERPDNLRKVNGVIRFSRGDALNGFAVTAMVYRARWNATDQIPSRAVADGRLGRFGLVDPSDGGRTSRVSGSIDWQRSTADTSTQMSAYGIHYALDLFSNFTYFLDDPVNGDQFQQTDRRVVSGARVTHKRLSRWAGRPLESIFGVQVRNDDIGIVGLYHTRDRRNLGTIREDSVLQTSVAAHAQTEIAWTPWLRTLAGVRTDAYRFDVDADHAENGGTRSAGIVSPKAGVIVGPFSKTELYVNAGFGFHSNDARGVTISVDPSSGARVDRVTPLARARGAEVGLRTTRIPRLHMTSTGWLLDLDSELIFTGDAGTTTASRPSRRQGIEWTSYYSPRPWLTFDADVAMSRARFVDVDPAGQHIPGAAGAVAGAGVTLDSLRNIVATMRWQYFGSRPLAEDNSQRSNATSLTSLSIGYRFTPSVRLLLDLFNLFDAKHSDIDYSYTSRLPGEPLDGIADRHFHPISPRTARLNLVVGF